MQDLDCRNISEIVSLVSICGSINIVIQKFELHTMVARSQKVYSFSHGFSSSNDHVDPPNCMKVELLTMFTIGAYSPNVMVTYGILYHCGKLTFVINVDYDRVHKYYHHNSTSMIYFAS